MQNLSIDKISTNLELKIENGQVKKSDLAKIEKMNRHKQIEELSDKIINSSSNTNLETENKINDIIYKAYKLNDKEIKFVENFYPHNIKS